VAKTILNKVKEKSDDEGKPLPAEFDGKENPVANSKNDKSDSGVDRSRERERSRGRERDARGRDSDRDSRGRESDRERDRRRCSRERSSGIAEDQSDF
jgi:cyclin L